jgi:hypothetical protein
MLMKKQLTGPLAALALLAAAITPQAHAQTLYGNINQPPVSPYLNVLRGGAPAGVNYYNIVQPQLQFYSAINQLQYQQQQQQAFLSTNASGALITGHPVQFSNPSHFFPQTGAGPRGGSIPLGFRGSQSSQILPQQSVAPLNLGTAPSPGPVRAR